MPQYLYPQNLRAETGLWLWTMRDFTVVALCGLAAVFVLTATKSPVPLALAALYGFLTIRLEDNCVLDFLSWATRFFVTEQQYFEWKEGFYAQEKE